MNSTWFGQNRKDLLANDDSASTTTAGTTTNSRRLRGERSGYSEAFDKLKESRRKQSGEADGETDAETALKRVRGRDIFRSKGKRTRDTAKDAGETAEKAAKGHQSKASKLLSERTERKSRRQGRKLMDNAQFIEYFCNGGYGYFCTEDGTDILKDQVCAHDNIEEMWGRKNAIWLEDICTTWKFETYEPIFCQMFSDYCTAESGVMKPAYTQLCQSADPSDFGDFADLAEAACEIYVESSIETEFCASNADLCSADAAGNMVPDETIFCAASFDITGAMQTVDPLFHDILASCEDFVQDLICRENPNYCEWNATPIKTFICTNDTTFLEPYMDVTQECERVAFEGAICSAIY